MTNVGSEQGRVQVRGPKPANNAERRRLLGIYLNDHLMGASSGVELARRLARTFQRSPYADLLGDVAAEIEEDRASLIELMRQLDIPLNRPKMVGGWLAEKVGRLKLNGRLLRRSPLSGLIELEMMHLGVEGKEAGWRLLRELAPADPTLEAQDFDHLISRAERQKHTLDEIRQQTADVIFVQG